MCISVCERERGWGGELGGRLGVRARSLGVVKRKRVGEREGGSDVLDTTLRYVCRFAFNIWYGMHYVCALVDEMR